MQLHNVETVCPSRPQVDGQLLGQEVVLSEVFGTAFGPSDRAANIQGQRYACIAVRIQDEKGNFSSHEDSALFSSPQVHIDTFQVFPTPPSAIRFARLLICRLSTVLKIRLLVVPTLEWIRLDELAYYNPKGLDIEEILSGKHTIAAIKQRDSAFKRGA